jgi:ribosome-associated protein
LSRRGSVPGAAPAAVELVRVAVELALDKKAQAVTLLDLRAFPLNTDYFLIASGASDLHVRAIADGIVDELRRLHGVAPWHVEGRANGRWVLLDYVDWVVHIFHRETREYYLLERLWGDAPRETFGDEDPVEVSDEDAE